ncbi:MAG TPA: hypothetical protein VIK76_07140 [Pyrinomonadaceae bacterium]
MPLPVTQQTTVATEPIFATVAAGIAAIDFNDLQSMLDGGEALMRDAAHPAQLRALLERTRTSPDLLAQCEHFNLFDKILLYEDRERSVKLRLHVFGGEVREMHHHRASFAALVLHGSYRHLLFGDEKGLGDPSDGPSQLQPLLAQEQRPGTSYAIHHAMVHATVAKPETVSLMLQAPVARESFRIYDLETGRRRDRYGKEKAADVQEEGESRITSERIVEIGASLQHWGLI